MILSLAPAEKPLLADYISTLAHSLRLQLLIFFFHQNDRPFFLYIHASLQPRSIYTILDLSHVERDSIIRNLPTFFLFNTLYTPPKMVYIYIAGFVRLTYIYRSVPVN